MNFSAMDKNLEIEIKETTGILPRETAAAAMAGKKGWMATAKFGGWSF